MSGIDAGLIKKCTSRDEHSLFVLYRHCYPLLKGIASRYVYDKEYIGEVVNSGFLKIVNGLTKYDVNKPFYPWASTIMIRVAIDHVRKVMRQKTNHPVDYFEDLTPVSHRLSSQNLADLNFDAAELTSMLNILPQQTKVVFNLFAIDGYSHKEISQRLEISVGTSKWHVSKARAKLQEEILNIMKKNESTYAPSHR